MCTSRGDALSVEINRVPVTVEATGIGKGGEEGVGRLVGLLKDYPTDSYSFLTRNVATFTFVRYRRSPQLSGCGPRMTLVGRVSVYNRDTQSYWGMGNIWGGMGGWTA
jgi:hypothetical protein